MNRVIRCPGCGCVRSTDELMPGLDVTELGKTYHIPDSFIVLQAGTIRVLCPKCGVEGDWDDIKYETKKGEEMTNWNDLDKAKDEAKSYVTFPDNVDVYVGIQQGPVTYKKFVDDSEVEIKKESGIIEILKEGQVKTDLVGKPQYWALTDYWGMTEKDVKPVQKELSTLSSGLMQELRLLDDEGKLYPNIIKIRKIPGATPYQTKYRATVVMPKPKK